MEPEIKQDSKEGKLILCCCTICNSRQHVSLTAVTVYWLGYI